MLIKEASWISLKQASPTAVPVFRRHFPCEKPVRSAVLDTVNGRIRSFWKHIDEGIRYEIDTPVPAEIVIAGRSVNLPAGRYLFGQ